jgi:hypothetical protein
VRLHAVLRDARTSEHVPDDPTTVAQQGGQPS